MSYLLQVYLHTAIMILIYRVSLKDKPLHGFSRYYLIASAVLPLLIPFLRLPEFAQKSLPLAAGIEIGLQEIMVKATPATISQVPELSKWLWLGYCIVASCIIALNVRNIVKLLGLVRNNKKVDHGNYILITDCGFGPGSFGRYVLITGTEADPVIIEHELAHIQHRHTYDILFVNLLQALCWPNLLLLWIRKELQAVHEFQADSKVTVSKEAYSHLLLSTVFSTNCLPVMHSFIIHPIKRRIVMLQKREKTNPVKTALILGSIVCLFLSTAVVLQSYGQNAPKGNKAADKNAQEDRPVEGKIGQMPECKYDLPKFLGDNVKYPDSARVKGIEGKVIVRFVVNKTGKIIDPVILRSPDTTLSTEALRVVNMMPPWVPGKNKGKKVPVYFMLPISFKLQ